jgi:hypothetical protein
VQCRSPPRNTNPPHRAFPPKSFLPNLIAYYMVVPSFNYKQIKTLWSLPSSSVSMLFWRFMTENFKNVNNRLFQKLHSTHPKLLHPPFSNNQRLLPPSLRTLLPFLLLAQRLLHSTPTLHRSLRQAGQIRAPYHLPPQSRQRHLYHHDQRVLGGP